MVEDKWLSLKSMLAALRDTFIPKHKMTDKPNWRDKGSFPMNAGTREVIKSKNNAFRAWMAAKTCFHMDAARAVYIKARNKSKTLLRKSKRIFEMGIAQRSMSNPKAFWSHCRRKLKTKCSVAPLLADTKDKDSLRFTDEDKANILQKQFSSVFTKEPEGTIPTITKRTNSVISELRVTEEMVRLHLSKINVNKSCGPVEVHPRMLFELANIIAEPVAFLFNLIFEQEILPKDWKLAFVSPIFKKGSRSVAENYRPISLTSILCNVMESFVKESVRKHLMMNNLLSKKQ